MKTLVIATTALLVAAGSAFAGRLDTTSANPPQASVDSTYTSSVTTGSEIFIGQPKGPDFSAQEHRSHWGD